MAPSHSGVSPSNPLPSQAGAYVSNNSGANWSAYHVIVYARTDNRTIDRVPHDYQRIVPDLRGDQIAFPSDQVVAPLPPTLPPATA